MQIKIYKNNEILWYIFLWAEILNVEYMWPISLWENIPCLHYGRILFQLVAPKLFEYKVVSALWELNLRANTSCIKMWNIALKVPNDPQT